MISRRDFLNGVGMTAMASLSAAAAGHSLPAADLLAAGEVLPPGAYPPALLGLRGNHEGSQAYPHALRDGTDVARGVEPKDLAEQYDLVVVGAGISGLSAAHYYRKNFGTDARILILDNHDDFGGHARRNEFDVAGRTLLSFGGTQAIDNPETYRPIAKALLLELGVRVSELKSRYDATAYAGLGAGYFFGQEAFGVDRLVPGFGARPWREFLAQAPLPDQERSEVLRLYTDKRDYLKHIRGIANKQRLLEKISYAEYLTRYCGAGNGTLRFFQTFTHDLFGAGIDAVSAFACYENPDDYAAFRYPGFDGLGLEPVSQEPYQYMFPDGNSSIARLIVRRMIPDAVPGTSAEGIVGARTRYDRLDVAQSAVRLRLKSAVVDVARMSSESGRTVRVTYARGDRLERVTAKHCVLACNNSMIPYLCPSLPEEQKAALHYAAKVPFLYTHVALRNSRSFSKLGVRHIVSPGAYHSYTALSFPVSSPGYHHSSDPDSPNVLFMLRAPCSPGLNRRAQHRAGRAELVATRFDTIEGNIRDQLQRMLGSAGFDHERDIAGITVNRWAHGYAYEYDSLSDPAWEKGKAPHEVGRRPFGPIAIANSDSAASAYTDAAIDMAHRAVQELPR